jgi:hypothetical protein
LIHCPPQIVLLALNREPHFIHLPLVAGPRTPPTELISVGLTKFMAPLANGFIRNDDSTFQQELFAIPEAQAEPKVEPHRVADDLNGEMMVPIARG